MNAVLDVPPTGELPSFGATFGIPPTAGVPAVSGPTSEGEFGGTCGSTIEASHPEYHLQL